MCAHNKKIIYSDIQYIQSTQYTHPELKRKIEEKKSMIHNIMRRRGVSTSSMWCFLENAIFIAKIMLLSPR